MKELNILTWELLLLCPRRIVWFALEWDTVTRCILSLYLSFWEQHYMHIHVSAMALQAMNVWENLKNLSLNSGPLTTAYMSFSLLHPILCLPYFTISLTMFYIFLSSISYSLFCNCYSELAQWIIWYSKYFTLSYAVFFLSYAVYFSFLLQAEKCRFIKHFLWLFEGGPAPLVEFCFSLNKRKDFSF